MSYGIIKNMITRKLSTILKTLSLTYLSDVIAINCVFIVNFGINLVEMQNIFKTHSGI